MYTREGSNGIPSFVLSHPVQFSNPSINYCIDILLLIEQILQEIDVKEIYNKKKEMIIDPKKSEVLTKLAGDIGTLLLYNQDCKMSEHKNFKKENLINIARSLRELHALSFEVGETGSGNTAGSVSQYRFDQVSKTFQDKVSSS
jgi:hypothetical protein